MIGNLMSACIRIVRPAYIPARRAATRMWDRRLGVTTVNEDVARELGPRPGVDYRAISYPGMRRLMRRLEPTRKDALLDFGCGAGRATCAAAQYPFSRVIGIEIDEPLCALAKRNAMGLHQCMVRPEIVHADATTYPVPDDVTVVFLYNSFRGEVLEAALTRVLESFDRNPRRLRLAYANPREHALIDSMRRFRATETLWLSWRPEAAWHRTQAVQFYEVEPADVQGQRTVADSLRLERHVSVEGMPPASQRRH